MVFRYLLELIFVTYTIMARIVNTWIANLLMYCWNPLLTQILRFVGKKIGYKTGVVMISILGFGIPGFVKILCFIGQMVDMRTRVAILTTLGLEIPGFVEMCQDRRLANPGLWGNFRTLIYVIASAVMIFTQNHLIVGAACICAAMEFLIDINCHLTPEYVFVGASTLFVFVLYYYTARNVRIICTGIANLLMYCWSSLVQLFLGITEILRFVGQKIGNETGVVMITILGFGIPGFVRIGKILCFVGQKVDMGARVAILTILGLEIPGFVETCQDGRPATPGLWGDFRASIYVITSALMIFTQSHLIVGAACTCAAMEILIGKYRHLQLKYVLVASSTLFVFVLYGYTSYTPVRAHQRRG